MFCSTLGLHYVYKPLYYTKRSLTSIISMMILNLLLVAMCLNLKWISLFVLKTMVRLLATILFLVYIFNFSSRNKSTFECRFIEGATWSYGSSWLPLFSFGYATSWFRSKVVANNGCFFYKEIPLKPVIVLLRWLGQITWKHITIYLYLFITTIIILQRG